MSTELIPFASDLASLGAAGLMGVLWVWERRLSRTRERQLSEAHGRLVDERGMMQVVTTLVRRNTAALTSLQTTQHQLVHLLSSLRPGNGLFTQTRETTQCPNRE